MGSGRAKSSCLDLPSSARPDRLPRPPPAETLIYYLSHSKLKGITAERTDGRERGEPGEETPRLPRCAFSPPSASVQRSVRQSELVCVGQEVSSGAFASGGGEGKNCLIHPSIHPSREC